MGWVIKMEVFDMKLGYKGSFLIFMEGKKKL